jgi:hypothetical protein
MYEGAKITTNRAGQRASSTGAEDGGGGVSMWSTNVATPVSQIAKFNMHGGEILNNIGLVCAGGVSVVGGEFVMRDGKINNNNNNFNNVVAGGAGVSMKASGSNGVSNVQLLGGEITGNNMPTAATNAQGSGIQVFAGNLTLGGTVKIYGNLKGTAANNVYFSGTTPKLLLSTTTPPATGMDVMVNVPTATNPFPIVNSGGMVAHSRFFRPDATTRHVTWNTPGTLNVRNSTTPAVTYTATQQGGALNTANTTSIQLVFSATVANLTTDYITVTDGTGRVLKGALTGTGTTYNIAVTTLEQGNVTVDVYTFDVRVVSTPAQTVPVYVAKETITFDATQQGGVLDTTDTSSIRLEFNQPITGLVASNITIADDTGRVTKGA